MIVSNINRSGLTVEMVENFLTRCPPPRITPKSIEDTCNHYCLYQPVPIIAKAAILLESQVLSIIPNCSICEVDANDLKKICNYHLCDGKNISTISPEVKKPETTVKYLLTNNCTICNIDDPELRKRMCFNSKCRGFTSEKNGKDVGYSASVVEGFLANTNCDAIISSCVDELDEDTKNKIIEFRCLPGATPAGIAYFLEYTVGVVEEVLAPITAVSCLAVFFIKPDKALLLKLVLQEVVLLSKLKVPMTQNVIGTLSSIFFISLSLDCKDHFKSQYNFFSRIFVRVFCRDIQLYWICK